MVRPKVGLGRIGLAVSGKKERKQKKKYKRIVHGCLVALDIGIPKVCVTRRCGIYISTGIRQDYRRSKALTIVSGTRASSPYR